jgi:hypothetical protein
MANNKPGLNLKAKGKTSCEEHQHCESAFLEDVQGSVRQETRRIGSVNCESVLQICVLLIAFGTLPWSLRILMSEGQLAWVSTISWFPYGCWLWQYPRVSYE